MGVYSAIADHIRDLVLNEICPTANFDVAAERHGLTIRIDNTHDDDEIEELFGRIGCEVAEGGMQHASTGPSESSAPPSAWFLFVRITTANSAPLVIIQRVLTDEAAT